MKILVTGGAGFIGSHVVDAFVAAGHEVAVLDNLHTGTRANVNPAARFYEADLRDEARVRAILAAERPTLLCHHAALTDVRASLRDPVAYEMVNVVGTLHLLAAAHAGGTRRVLFASTGGALYGDVVGIPPTEQAATQPRDPYSVSKLAAEQHLLTFCHHHGLEACALRYANVYGPRQNPHGEAGVVAIFTHTLLRGERPTITGDGKQRRDFVFVEDVARANLVAAERGSGVYHVSTGVGTDILTLYKHLVTLAGGSHTPRHGPAQPGEVRVSVLDAQRARTEWGWEPRVPLAEGLARTVNAFRNPEK